MATQNLPGNISSRVAQACAMIAGWYLWPGAHTTPFENLVAWSDAPIQDHA
jgi:hypothetical protein